MRLYFAKPIAMSSFLFVQSADWTNRNEDIAMGLAKYNRTGIPLYIFWKPGMIESKILPAVLTEDLLIRNMQ